MKQYCLHHRDGVPIEDRLHPRQFPFPMGKFSLRRRQAARGTIGGRRPFVEIPRAEGMPDGMTVDADGCVWVAVLGHKGLSTIMIYYRSYGPKERGRAQEVGIWGGESDARVYSQPVACHSEVPGNCRPRDRSLCVDYGTCLLDDQHCHRDCPRSVLSTRGNPVGASMKLLACLLVLAFLVPPVAAQNDLGTGLTQP